MVSLSRLSRFSTVVLVAGGVLAGCGASVPEVTDEEIIALLGEKNAFAGQDAPLVIDKMTVECAEALSGANAEILKDMPAEILGMMKTDCRQEFDKIIKDSVRNTKGFKLEHFENKDFAKRIEMAAEKSQEIYADYRKKRDEEEKKRRAEEQARRKVEAEQKLAAAQAEFEHSLDGYEALADEIVALCTEIEDVMMTLQEQGQNAWLSGASGDCRQNRQDLLQAADDNRAIWAAVEIRENMDTGFREPYINTHGPGTNEGLERMISSLKSDLADFNRRLGRE